MANQHETRSAHPHPDWRFGPDVRLITAVGESMVLDYDLEGIADVVDRHCYPAGQVARGPSGWRHSESWA